MTFDLTQRSYMADHVINPSQSSNIHAYPFLSCELWRRPLVTVNDALGATANAPYHVISNILISVTPICLFTIPLLFGMMTINGRLQVTLLPVGGFRSSKPRPQNGGFRRKGRPKVKIQNLFFVTAKMHILERNRVV